MNYLWLLFTFIKTGLFSIGGGLATLPFLFEIADNSIDSNGTKWLTREIITDMLAIAQSVPGAIGVNLAAYTGFRYAGISGGYISALGLMLPSIIIIIFAARALNNFSGNKYLNRVFSGLRPAAAGLLSAAGINAIKIFLWDFSANKFYEYVKWKEALIFGLIFFLIVRFKKHPVIYIAGAGIVGAILKL